MSGIYSIFRRVVHPTKPQRLPQKFPLSAVATRPAGGTEPGVSKYEGKVR